MITVALGLCGAIVYGAADFLGGVAARTIRPITVTAITAAIGIAPLLAGILIVGARFSGAAVLWGAVGGASGAVGILLLYAALAIGPMSVLSPLTAVFSALLPVIVGVIRGTTLSIPAVIALVIAVAAVVLVAAAPSESGARLTMRGVLAAVTAGCGFGGLVLAFDATPSDSGAAPLLVARLLQALAMGGIAAVVVARAHRRNHKTNTTVAAAPTTTGSRWRLPLILIGCGVFDATANLFIQAGLHSSTDPLTLPIMSVLNALYPIGTVLLAGIVLRERLTRTQTLGISLAVTSSVALAIL